MFPPAVRFSRKCGEPNWLRPRRRRSRTATRDLHVCELRFYGGGTAAAAQTWSSAAPSEKASGPLLREELGFRSVNGLDLVGTRESQPLGLTATGSDRPLAVVKEFWFSKQLGLNVITRRDDPRSGIEAFTVTDIHLSEPDRALFTLPADSKVVDLRASLFPARFPDGRERGSGSHYQRRRPSPSDSERVQRDDRSTSWSGGRSSPEVLSRPRRQARTRRRPPRAACRCPRPKWRWNERTPLCRRNLE